MTQQQLIELVNQHHPQMGETEIRLFLNQALQLLAFKAGGVRDEVTGESTAGIRDYHYDDFDSTYSILNIESVYLADSDGTMYKIPRLVGTPKTEED